jgi:hypothetical protein
MNESLRARPLARFSLSAHIACLSPHHKVRATAAVAAWTEARGCQA